MTDISKENIQAAKEMRRIVEQFAALCALLKPVDTDFIRALLSAEECDNIQSVLTKWIKGD